MLFEGLTPSLSQEGYLCHPLSSIDHSNPHISQIQHISALQGEVFFVTLYFRRSFLFLKGSPHVKKAPYKEAKK